MVESTSDREHKRGRRFITIFLFSVASRFRNEEGSCYLVSSVQCANPSDRQHKRGRRFRLTMFLFSVASRLKNEEGSCYLLVVPCAIRSDRQHKRGRRFIALFLFSVASVTLKERERSMLCVPCYDLRFMLSCLKRSVCKSFRSTSEEEGSLQCSCLVSRHA